MGSQSGPARSGALRLWVVLAAALALAFLIDGPVSSLVQPLHHSRLADVISNTIRWPGTGHVQAAALLLMIAAGAIWARPVLRAGSWGLLAFLVSGALATLVKVLVHRPRPFVEVPPAESWLGRLTLSIHSSDLRSFPSGESTSTFAIAALLASLFPRLQLALVIAAVTIASARVVVGSHFPSDAVAGAILGIAVGRLVARRAGRTTPQGSPPQA